MGVDAAVGQIADLPASILLPQGRNGPAFLAYPNFDVFFEWNQSFVYVTTAAYFATRLEGAPIYDAGNPSPALGEADMKACRSGLSRSATTSAASTASSARRPARRCRPSSGALAFRPTHGRPGN